MDWSRCFVHSSLTVGSARLPRPSGGVPTLQNLPPHLLTKHQKPPKPHLTIHTYTHLQQGNNFFFQRKICFVFCSEKLTSEFLFLHLQFLLFKNAVFYVVLREMPFFSLGTHRLGNCGFFLASKGKW